MWILSNIILSVLWSGTFVKRDSTSNETNLHPWSNSLIWRYWFNFKKTARPSGLRAMDLKSKGSWFKSSSLALSGFVLGSPDFNSSTALCKWSPGQPPTSWNSNRYCTFYLVSQVAQHWQNFLYFILLLCNRRHQKCPWRWIHSVWVVARVRL